MGSASPTVGGEGSWMISVKLMSLKYSKWKYHVEKVKKFYLW